MAGVELALTWRRLVLVGIIVVVVVLLQLNRKGTDPEQVRASTDAESLKVVHAALTKYAEQHDGQYPPDLRDLVEAGLLEESQLVCESLKGASEGTPREFVYVSGHTTASSPESVVAFPPPGSYPPIGGEEGGIPVLGVNGEVALLKVKALTDAMQEQVLSEKTRLTNEVENLKAIHNALRQYAEQSGGRYPTNLGMLVEAGLLEAGQLICPSLKDLEDGGNKGYVYIGGYPVSGPPDSIVVFPPPDVYPLFGRGEDRRLPVLLLDGRILLTTRNALEDVIRRGIAAAMAATQPAGEDVPASQDAVFVPLATLPAGPVESTP